MRMLRVLLTSLLVLAPLAAHANPQYQPMQEQSMQAPQAQSSQDVFSYSYLQVNRLSEHSDFFNDRSTGNGLRFSYGLASGVYLFGQWNQLDFSALPGHQVVTGVGVGAHQAYSPTTSFFISLEYLHDRLSSGILNGAMDKYWRVNYGFRRHIGSLFELDGSIFTDRNTNFGSRPFGEHLGIGLNMTKFGIMLAGEHTADGNRIEAYLNWYYR